MHELIGAILYAENEVKALDTAAAVFSQHTGMPEYNDVSGLHMKRFDYFMMFDSQAARTHLCEGV